MTNKKSIENNIESFTASLTYSCWDEIRAIENQYANLKVPRSNNKFSESHWIVQNGQDKPLNLYFSNYKLPDGTDLGSLENYALCLFLKVRTFHLFQNESLKDGQPLAAKTIEGHFTRARSIIIPFMKEHRILCYNPSTRTIQSICNFSFSLVEELLASIIEGENKTGTQLNKLVTLQLYLSNDITIPACFRPPFSPFRQQNPVDYISCLNDDLEGHQPIPDDDFYWIGKSAIDFIENYSAPIIEIHALASDVWKMDPPTEIKDRYKEAQSKNGINGKSKVQDPVSILTEWRFRTLLRLMHENNMSFPNFSDEHLNCWEAENLPHFDPADSYSKLKQDIGISYVWQLFQLLYGACACLTLIPTGMRISELRTFDYSRLSKTPNHDGVFSYINGNMKIRAAGSFIEKNEIPVPVETVRAIRALDRLTLPIRRENNNLVFVAPLHLHTSTVSESDAYRTIEQFNDSVVNARYVRNSIAVYCRFIRSQTIPTPHQFRNSIAEFFLSCTRKAPILLCQLFGHKSITMTLKYLKQSSLIQRETKQYAIERFKTAAAVVARAISTNACAGPMVKRIVQAVNTRDEFQGLTQPEMQVALEEWLMARVADQSLFLVHTPTNVCCRSTKATDKPPCQEVGQDAYVSMHVSPAKCTGAKCDWSLFTFEEYGELNKSLIFYKHLLDTIDTSLLNHQHLLEYASSFVETYDPIAERIKKVDLEDIKGIVKLEAI